MLESPIHGPKILVFGGLTSKSLGNIVQTPKRHTFRGMMRPEPSLIEARRAMCGF